MNVLGISCHYHDSAACLITDGLIKAAGAEERFTRKKHDNGFPFKTIDYCLKEFGKSINELDAVVFYEKPIIKFERTIHQHLQNFPKSLSSALDSIPQWFNQKLRIEKILREELNYHGKIYYSSHHLSHAASAYYLSGFKKAAILTIDGVGEWATTTMGIGKNKDIQIDQEISFPHSLGLLYSTITTYLGFSANDAEYKVMGLAAYGNPDKYMEKFDKLVTQFPNGSYQLNQEYFSFDWSNKKMFSKKLVKLFGHQPRKPESRAYKYHKDIAASLQRKLEEIVVNMLNQAYKKYKTPNLCLAGGVALNSVLNGKILSQTPFKNLYIPPDPSDAGAAMGAALYITAKKDKHPIKWKEFNPYLGPKYSWYEIEKTLKEMNISYTFYADRKKLTKVVAKKLKNQKIIGWFQGRMEWGPRALGNRSILASAATTKMRDIINAKVKNRELFRPFAPVILEEYTDKYFESDKNLPISARYMLMVYPFKEIGYKQVPAVVHVDGSGRLQTLAKKDNPKYYSLIEGYEKLTKVPIIINTSFNVRGEPIVCNPKDAVNCFLHTDIDYLVIDQFICRKK
jgi:carbamoyltransferase